MKEAKKSILKPISLIDGIKKELWRFAMSSVKQRVKIIIENSSTEMDDLKIKLDNLHRMILDFEKTIPLSDGSFSSLYTIAIMNFLKTRDLIDIMTEIYPEHIKNWSDLEYFESRVTQLLSGTDKIISDCSAIAINLFTLAGGRYEKDGVVY